MRQRATVGSLLPDGSVSLLVQRVSACTGDCGHCGGCGAVSQSVQVTARAPFPVEPGERVWVESRSGAVLGAAALVYLLPLGLLLAVAGGFFDAYTYLCRGGVFANAQTGNIVLFGARLAEGDWRKALTYLLPILAFAFGVLTAEAVKRRYKSRQNRDINIHWRQIVVMVEIALVVVAAMLPQKLNPTVNIIISFVCAMQVETFRKVRGSAFATTMCTGNLRSGTEQFIIWQQTGDKTARKKMRNYYSIILIFILGGAIGTLSTHTLGEKALLLTLVPLLTVFFIMFIEEEREEIEDNGGQA